MTINDPEVIAELHALYSEYEQALVANDVERLVGMFWDAPHVGRFGATEKLYGGKELLPRSVHDPQFWLTAPRARDEVCACEHSRMAGVSA